MDKVDEYKTAFRNAYNFLMEHKDNPTNYEQILKQTLKYQENTLESNLIEAVITELSKIGENRDGK